MIDTTISRMQVTVQCAEYLCNRVLRVNGKDAARYVKLQHKYSPGEALLVCSECWEYPDVQDWYTGPDGNWKKQQP